MTLLVGNLEGHAAYTEYYFSTSKFPEWDLWGTAAWFW